MDNTFVESFNGHFRVECLNQHLFTSLEKARAVIEQWRVEYNQERSHRAHQQQTPSGLVGQTVTTSGAPG